jgi:hypothetical protein
MKETSRIGNDIFVESNMDRITRFAQKIHKDNLLEGLTVAC